MNLSELQVKTKRWYREGEVGERPRASSSTLTASTLKTSFAGDGTPFFFGDGVEGAGITMVEGSIRRRFDEREVGLSFGPTAIGK